MKNLEANNHFKAAEAHIKEGRHDEAWKELGQAQSKAAAHAHSLSEGGNHKQALAYRKMTLGRVGHLATRMRDGDSEPVKKALTLSEMQIAKAQALTYVWELMKKEGAGRYKYLIPQIELARTTADINTLFTLYGFKPLRKTDTMKEENYPLEIGGHVISKPPQTPAEREEQWERILTASKEIEKKLGIKKREQNK